ncbi:MAG: hypothetical protein QOC57_1735 [Ilumatobacteraceae bacterium]
MRAVHLRLGSGRERFSDASWETRRSVIAAALAVVAAAIAVAPADTVSAEGFFSDGRSAYTSVTPCRLADTRDPNLQADPVDKATERVQAAGVCGISSHASAVAVTITVTGTIGDGYAVVTPAETSGPTSTINWSASETRAASTVVAVSGLGAIDVRVSGVLGDQSIIVDVVGSWSRSSSPVAGGRLITIAGHRAVDTRVGDGPVGAGDSITLDRAALGIPISAVAVAGTLTSANAGGAGFLTAYPAGTGVPLASNVNTDHAGQNRAAGIIVALGSPGLSIFAGAAATDVIVDVTGYITGTSDPISTQGLLIPVAPRRILDTRTIAGAVTAAATDVGMPFAKARIEGVIATITSTDATRAGFATLTAVGSPDTAASQTSALNWSGNPGAVAAMTVQPVGAANALEITSPVAGSFIIDVTGYLLGDQAPNGPDAPAPGRNALAVGRIDDRTGSGQPNGDPIVLLRQSYTANQLAAGGAVALIRTEIEGGYPAMVPNNATAFPACAPEPMCVMVAPSSWDRARVAAVDANRVMISHEWAHVLSFRYQQWMDTVAYADWQPRHDSVNEECLADAVAAIALEGAGLPGNETPDYVVHYMCDQYWLDTFGGARLTAMQAEAHSLAVGLLDWAEQWGSSHH